MLPPPELSLTIPSQSEPTPSPVPTAPYPVGPHNLSVQNKPKLHINPPEWDGTKDTLEDFLDQCELNFEANPLQIGNMMGAPQTRIRNVCQHPDQPNWMHSWDTFCANLCRVYRDPNPSSTTCWQLDTLVQCRPITKHAAEFMLLAAHADATDEQQMMYTFEKSLCCPLRKQLIQVPHDSIHSFINTAILMEQQMQAIQDMVPTTFHN